MNLTLKSVSIAIVSALAFTCAQAAPISHLGTLSSGVTVFGDVPRNSFLDSATWDFWKFFGIAGDSVTITLNRTSDQMDPGVELFRGLGGDTAGLASGGSSGPADGLLTFLAIDDDGGSDIPPGPFFNSLIANFALSATGYYTIAAYDVLGAGTGPWTYGLTVTGNTGGAIPEPASLALVGLALAGMGLSRRRRTARQ